MTRLRDASDRRSGVGTGTWKGNDDDLAQLGQRNVQIGETYETVVNIAREILGHGGRSSPVSNTSFENIRNAIQTRFANSGIPIRGAMLDPAAPTVEAVAQADIASLEHEIRVFLASEGISLTAKTSGEP